MSKLSITITRANIFALVTRNSTAKIAKTNNSRKYFYIFLQIITRLSTPTFSHNHFNHHPIPAKEFHTPPKSLSNDKSSRILTRTFGRFYCNIAETIHALILIDAPKRKNNNKVKISIFAKGKDYIMPESIDQPKGKTKITIKGLPFEPKRNQILFYDPQGNSEYSQAIESQLGKIKKEFVAEGYEFCYFPDMAKNISDEIIRYSFPNWNGQPLNIINNDLLKPFIATEDQDIGACFIRRCIALGELLCFHCCFCLLGY